jgi:hypothetical protein
LLSNLSKSKLKLYFDPGHNADQSAAAAATDMHRATHCGSTAAAAGIALRHQLRLPPKHLLKHLIYQVVSDVFTMNIRKQIKFQSSKTWQRTSVKILIYTVLHLLGKLNQFKCLECILFVVKVISVIIKHERLVQFNLYERATSVRRHALRSSTAPAASAMPSF